MKVHDLAPATGSKKNAKRVGRGTGGKGGKTAGRGTKGLKCHDVKGLGSLTYDIIQRTKPHPNMAPWQKYGTAFFVGWSNERGCFPTRNFQQTYFVIDSFEQLLESCYKDFGNIYASVKGRPDYEAHELVDGDHILTRGTREYFLAKQQKKSA